MIYGIFYWVVNISILATVAGLAVICIRAVKRIPRSVIYMLWSLVFIRFTIPVMYSSKYSVMNILTLLGSRTIVMYEQTKPDISLTTTNTLTFADCYFPIIYKSETSNILTGIFNIAAIIWIIVAAACIITMAILYLVTKKEIQGAVKYRDNIYICKAVSTPTVYGIFKPKIILPYEISDDKLQYILAHESVHIRCADNLRRILALFISCMYWFNPFIWLFLKAYFSDMEISCDRNATKNYNIEECKKYAYTLLDFTSARRTIVSNTFTGASIKIRIENILNYKKLSIISSITIAIFAIAIIYTLFTNSI